MRQKQAEGTYFPAGLSALLGVRILRRPQEEFEIEKHLETNLMAAFAKKEAASASSGGKK